MSHPQQILEFPVDPVFTFDTFIEGASNHPALRAVRAVVDAPRVSLVVTGDEGCGKSHLLHAAIGERRRLAGAGAAWFLDPERLAGLLADGGEGALSRFLDSLGAGLLVALDDLDRLRLTPPACQEGVLYLYNRLRESGGALLVASRQAPGVLEWLRPDLRSRLLWGELVEIVAPQDAELEAILVKLAADRQVRLGRDLVKFLCLRLPRRIPDLVAALARLDRAGLERQRPLTVPLAKEALGL